MLREISVHFVYKLFVELHLKLNLKKKLEIKPKRLDMFSFS